MSAPIAVDYDLLDQQIDALADAIAYHDESTPLERVDQIQDTLDVEHLRGLCNLCCTILLERPFPETREAGETP